MENKSENQVLFTDEKERQSFFNMNITVHEKLVRSICAGILDTKEDVEDAVQDTMLKAWIKLESLRSSESAKSWLCTIARNSALDMRDRIVRNTAVKLESESVDLLDELIPSNEPGPEDILLLHYQQETMEKAFYMLPEKYRLLVYLRFFLCADVDEIEQKTGFKDRERINACYRARLAMKSYVTKLQR